MKRISPIALVVLAFVIFATMACICSSVVPFLDPVEPLVFDPDELPDAQVGVPYEVTISISQNRTPAGDISLSEGTLPPELELVYVQAEDTAKITGTPTQTGRLPSPSASGATALASMGRRETSSTRSWLGNEYSSLTGRKNLSRWRVRPQRNL